MIKKSYTPEFRNQVIKEALDTGNCALVARRHDMNQNIVNRWMREHKNGKKPLPGKEELKRIANSESSLSNEVRTLATDNEKLKKLLGESELENAILRDLVKKLHPHLEIK